MIVIDMQRDFMNNTTSKEKIYFFCSLISHAILQFSDMGFAFYFMTPTLLCKQNQQEDYRKCSYVDACSSQFGYKIDDSSPNNLSRQFGLVCEREYLKLLCTQIILAMGSLGTIFLLLIKIKNNRQFYINLLILHLVCLVLFQFQSNVIMSALCLGLAINFPKQLFWSNMWIYSKQILSQEASTLYTAYDGFFWSIVGMIIPTILFLYDSNIYLIMWIVVFIQSCLLYIFLQTFSQSDTVKQSENLEPQYEKSTFEILKESPYLIFNIFLISQDYLMYYFPALFIMIELRSFGGNIYLNMGSYEFFGLFSQFFAFYFLKQKNIQSAMGCLLLLFIFKSGGSEHPIFILMMLIYKLLGDTMFALNMKVLFDYMPIDVVQFYFAYNAIQTRTLLIFQPSVSLYILKKGIHPLFVYGLYTLLLVYLQQYMKPNDSKDLNFDDVNDQQRKSVLEQIQKFIQPNQSIIIQRISQISYEQKNDSLIRTSQIRMSRISQNKKQSNF